MHISEATQWSAWNVMECQVGTTAIHVALSRYAEYRGLLLITVMQGVLRYSNPGSRQPTVRTFVTLTQTGGPQQVDPFPKHLQLCPFCPTFSWIHLGLGLAPKTLARGFLPNPFVSSLLQEEMRVMRELERNSWFNSMCMSACLLWTAPKKTFMLPVVILFDGGKYIFNWTEKGCCTSRYVMSSAVQTRFLEHHFVARCPKSVPFKFQLKSVGPLN